jgi:hypothetical protein
MAAVERGGEQKCACNNQQKASAGSHGEGILRKELAEWSLPNGSNCCGIVIGFARRLHCQRKHENQNGDDGDHRSNSISVKRLLVAGHSVTFPFKTTAVKWAIENRGAIAPSGAGNGRRANDRRTPDRFVPAPALFRKGKGREKGTGAYSAEYAPVPFFSPPFFSPLIDKIRRNEPTITARRRLLAPIHRLGWLTGRYRCPC